MSDQPNSTTPAPVVVKADVRPELWAQTGRVVALFAFGWALNQVVHSEQIIGPIMAAAGVVATLGGSVAVAAYGIWKRLRSHRLLKGLVAQVPDDVATLK